MPPNWEVALKLSLNQLFNDFFIQIRNIVANREEKMPVLSVSVINNEIHVDVDDKLQKENENVLKI